MLLVCGFIGSLLLSKLPIKSPNAVGSELAEPATNGHTKNLAHDSIDPNSIDYNRPGAVGHDSDQANDSIDRTISGSRSSLARREQLADTCAFC